MFVSPRRFALLLSLCLTPLGVLSAGAADQLRLATQATGTFKYRKGLPAGGRKILRDNASD